jgi:hypothetical protein
VVVKSTVSSAALPFPLLGPPTISTANCVDEVTIGSMVPISKAHLKAPNVGAFVSNRMIVDVRAV